MTIEKIEQAYNDIYKAVELNQKVYHNSFYQSYIDVLDYILDNYQISDDFKSKASEDDNKELLNYFNSLKNIALDQESRRKVTQLVLLKGLMVEALQPNHQLTPDSLGFLIVYLIEQLTNKSDLTILDPAVGTGNLLYTTMLNVDKGQKFSKGYGIDIDDILLSIADVDAEFLNMPVELFHQDGISHLVVDLVDVIVSDLPVGYYPHDDKAKDYTVYHDKEHTYAHHLMIENSMRYLKDDGLAFFLVPSNLLMSEQADCFKQLISQEVYLQAILKLPTSMFKDEHGQKDLIILQKRSIQTRQAEVLVANISSIVDKNVLQQFFHQLDEWKENEFTVN